MFAIIGNLIFPVSIDFLVLLISVRTVVVSGLGKFDVNGIDFLLLIDLFWWCACVNFDSFMSPLFWLHDYIFLGD